MEYIIDTTNSLNIKSIRYYFRSVDTFRICRTREYSKLLCNFPWNPRDMRLMMPTFRSLIELQNTGIDESVSVATPPLLTHPDGSLLCSPAHTESLPTHLVTTNCFSGLLRLPDFLVDYFCRTSNIFFRLDYV